MINDIISIVRKDLKEILSNRGNARSGAVYLLIVVGVMGILMPIQSGREWFTEPLIPLVWSWFPIFLVISVVTDSFAGERERNTLETLLASRLSDKAILFGKISAAVLYGWGIAIVSNLVAVVSINVSDPQGGFQFYDLPIYLALVIIPLLASLLMSGIGVLVSLNAPTARAAYQKLSIAMLAIWLLPTILINFAGKEINSQMSAFLLHTNLAQLGIGLGVIVLLVDIVLIYIATKRFKRARLILN
jgi:ABC-2 type transport system permease protein